MGKILHCIHKILTATDSSIGNLLLQYGTGRQSGVSSRLYRLCTESCGWRRAQYTGCERYSCKPMKPQETFWTMFLPAKRLILTSHPAGARILMFSHGEYDSLFCRYWRPLPFWLENETVREYWSENHMIMWMASTGSCTRNMEPKLTAHSIGDCAIISNWKYSMVFVSLTPPLMSPYCFLQAYWIMDFMQDAEIKSPITQAAQKITERRNIVADQQQGRFVPDCRKKLSRANMKVHTDKSQ